MITSLEFIMFFVENDGDEIKATNFWKGHDYSNRFCFLSKGETQWRLLIPDNSISMIDDIWVSNMAVIEKSRDDKDCIDISFPNGVAKPFVITLDKRLVDKKITPGDFIMTVWSRQIGLAIKLNCHIKAKRTDAIENQFCRFN